MAKFKATIEECGVCRNSEQVIDKLNQLFEEILRHDGYGRIEVDMKILRKGQKEIVLRCGKEYRYVVDFPPGANDSKH